LSNSGGFGSFHIRVIRDFVDRRHDPGRGSLMDHMAGPGNAVKPALRDLGMQARRLLIDVDQAVFLGPR
jgi:hypothetical protein